MAAPRRMLITAGPTYEPIDEVRFIGNRSSGRLGVALAAEASRTGWEVTLLLGPNAVDPAPGCRVRRFRTTADLESLLNAEFPTCDVLIMAAAVADYRPVGGGAAGKLRRTDAGLTIQLEATPDLLAGIAKAKKLGQLIIGFALEPRDRLVESAKSKIVRKGMDAIVANPLETMNSIEIEATFISADGRCEATGTSIPKPMFAEWLMDRIESLSPR